MTKTATISLHANTYQVDAALVGRKVEVVYDPMDLTELSVRYQGRDMGKAVPFKISRHVHPAAATSPPPPPVPTGIDYLNLIATTQQQQLATNINYNSLHTPTPAASAEPGGLVIDLTRPGQIPGQLDLTELTTADRAGELA